MLPEGTVLPVTDLINALSAYIDKPVIFSDQAAPKPPYPFISVKITSQFIPEPGQPEIENEDQPEDIKQTATSQPTMVMSVTEYTNSLAAAGELAQVAHDWFEFAGYHQLKDIGFVLADITGITNRDSLIIDDYERRRGFDVTLRFVHSVERIIEEIKKVEGTINDGKYEIGVI